MNIEKLLGSYIPLLKKIEGVADQHDIAIEFLFCDHLCYRVETLERYEELKEELRRYGRIVTEALVNARPIATFQLFEPIHYGEWLIPAIELPAPKKGSPYKEGWEHAEFAVGDIEAFARKYAHLPLRLPKTFEGLNPEVTIFVDEETQMKFHSLPLLKVIELENKLGSTTC